MTDKSSDPAPVVSGRKITTIMLAVVLIVVGAFIAAVMMNLDLIRQAVEHNRK